MCGYGYTVAGGALASFFASDLIHRLFHTDKIGEGTVFHYADTYDECLGLAVEAPEEAVRNAHTLQYFALDVYAYDIANPGQGCTGEPVVEEEEETADASSSVTSSAVASSTSSESSSSTSSADASSTTEPTSTLDAEESTTESATESAESVSKLLRAKPVIAEKEILTLLPSTATPTTAASFTASKLLVFDTRWDVFD